MHADVFYQTEGKGTVPLVLVNSPQWQDGNIELNEGERCQLQSQGFNARLGQLCLIYTPSGHLAKAFLGQGEAGDAQAMAYAATLLPEGQYETTHPLSAFAQVNWGLAQYRFDRYKKQERSPRRLVVSKENLKALTTEVEAVF